MARRSITLALACAIALCPLLVACSAPATPASQTAEKPTGIVGAWENNKWGQEICFFFCANGKAFMLMPTCNDREDAVEYTYEHDDGDMTLSQKGEAIFTPKVEFVDDDNIEFDISGEGASTPLERGDHTMTLCGG
jgi:hypothetical protein